MGRRLALLIGTDEYEDEGLRRLTTPGADTEALAAVLSDPEVAGFEATVLVNEPHYRVGEAIAELYRDCRRDDLALLYFSGHGLKDDEGRLYLAMTNTRRDNLLFTGLAADQVDQAMTACRSRQQVLILDCCYSGAFPAGRLAKSGDDLHVLERFHGRGRTVLTASDSTQYAFEGDKITGNAERSVFTHWLVEGLRNGNADLDGDGDITLDELYSYVYDRVVDELPHQRPKRQDNVEGRTVIARNVNWTLPGYLGSALASPIAADRRGALDNLAHLHRIGNEIVRRHVVTEIERLADDDSKSVSAAAQAWLAPRRQPESDSHQHQPLPPAVDDPGEQAGSAPTPPAEPVIRTSVPAAPRRIEPSEATAPSLAAASSSAEPPATQTPHAESLRRNASAAVTSGVSSAQRGGPPPHFVCGVLSLSTASLLLVLLALEAGSFRAYFVFVSSSRMTAVAALVGLGALVIWRKRTQLLGPGILLGSATSALLLIFDVWSYDESGFKPIVVATGLLLLLTVSSAAFLARQDFESPWRFRRYREPRFLVILVLGVIPPVVFEISLFPTYHEGMVATAIPAFLVMYASANLRGPILLGWAGGMATMIGDLSIKNSEGYHLLMGSAAESVPARILVVALLIIAAALAFTWRRTRSKHTDTQRSPLFQFPRAR